MLPGGGWAVVVCGRDSIGFEESGFGQEDGRVEEAGHLFFGRAFGAGRRRKGLGGDAGDTEGKASRNIDSYGCQFKGSDPDLLHAGWLRGRGLRLGEQDDRPASVGTQCPRLPERAYAFFGHAGFRDASGFGFHRLPAYRAQQRENSANESTVRGEKVNHQYSKSLEFENDFREYVRTYIGSEYDYFSFLRPLNEIGIARLFASIPLYHSLFRSCNAGSKTDSWCGKCPKCLFAFIILCPFLGIGKTSLIFGKNLLDDMDLQGFLDELCGKAAVKPFECVGTVDEVNWSLRQLRAYAAENALLRYYFGIPEGDASEGNDNVRPAVPAGDGDALLEGFSSENNVPEGLLSELKEAVAEVRLRQDADSETGHLIRNPLPDTVCGAFRPFFEKAGPIAVLGFGREGQSTYRFVRKLLPAKEICVIDRNEAVRSNPLLAHDKAVRFLTGDAYLEDFAVQMRSGAFGIVMKTPGISLKDYPDLLASPLLSSQADLFLRVYAPQVIGITGTKGKSTTTMLAYHLLSASRPCLLAGNMGRPFFEILDEIGPGTWIVGEFSAHQLEQVRRAPRIGVLLNLYEEHLDHYRSYLDYQQAKMNIAGRGITGGEVKAKMPDTVWPEDEGKRVLIYNEDDGLVCERIEERFPEMHSGDSLVSFLSFSLRSRAALYMNRKKRVVACSMDRKPKEVVFDLSQPHPLIGKHNVLNLMAALLAAHATGVPYKDLAGRIASFKPLPHRLEYVGCVDGVYYFDDSISTIPEAAVRAVESLLELPYVKGVDTLILGGFDRGGGFPASWENQECGVYRQGGAQDLAGFVLAGCRRKGPQACGIPGLGRGRHGGGEESGREGLGGELPCFRRLRRNSGLGQAGDEAGFCLPVVSCGGQLRPFQEFRGAGRGVQASGAE